MVTRRHLEDFIRSAHVPAVYGDHARDVARHKQILRARDRRSFSR
jgi:hypothetical protein